MTKNEDVVNENTFMGKVDGKKFCVNADTTYNHEDIKKQCPHLSDSEAKAVEAHTKDEHFINGVKHQAEHNGHTVQTVRIMGPFDKNESVNDLDESEKVHTINITRRGQTRQVSGTLSSLISDHKYTLETGKSYKNERGNKKIDMNPKTIHSLVKHLNNAKRNAAANGSPDTSYSLHESAVIANMLNAIVDNDTITSSEIFSQAMKQKIAEMMEQKRIEVAGSLMSESVELNEANVPGHKLEAGQELHMLDNKHGIYTHVRVNGVTGNDKEYGEGGVKYKSVGEALKANGVTSLKDLEAKDDAHSKKAGYGHSHYLSLTANPGKKGREYNFHAYVFKGRWATGSGADRATFHTPNASHNLEESTELNEYFAHGYVNNKKFKISTPDEYDTKSIHKQNPHLTHDEADAVCKHTESDEFIDGENHTSEQGKHTVRVTKNGGGYGETKLDESYRSSPILPASKALDHGTKSSLEDVGKTWDKKVTVLAVHTDGGIKKFISGSGHSTYHKVGDVFKAHHDQTMRNLGHHIVDNVIHMDGGKVIHSENNVGLDEKRPLSVFK